VSRSILHIDLDQFIAAVELLRRPDLRGRPVVIGGDGDPTKRGVVSTASYEARGFGIQSGMALRTAFRRCPEAVFLPVDADTYRAVSRQVMATLRGLPGVLEVAGWDEAFLDADTADPEGLARDVQWRVRAATHLECSVGIGDNKVRAKIASGFAKPAGVFRLTEENWAEVMNRRPTEALWGIGRKRARQLAGMGIPTVAALAEADPHDLARTFGPATGPWLARLARGESDSPVTSEPHRPRSRGRETTFQEDLEDLDRIREEIRRLAAHVAEDVREEGRPAVRVVVKVRFAPFITRSHGAPVDPPADDQAALERAALDALDRFELARPVRLLGVRADLA
jgi:DNA polymerase IV